MKKLGIKIDFVEKTVQVITQSHRGKEFGDGKDYFEHNGFFLRSVSTPQIRENAFIELDDMGGSHSKKTPGMYVMGAYPCARDTKICKWGVADSAWISRLYWTVRAYNKYFGEDKIETPTPGSSFTPSSELWLCPMPRSRPSGSKPSQGTDFHGIPWDKNAQIG